MAGRREGSLVVVGGGGGAERGREGVRITHTVGLCVYEGLSPLCVSYKGNYDKTQWWYWQGTPLPMG